MSRPLINSSALEQVNTVFENLRKFTKELELHSIVLQNMAEGVCLIRVSDGLILYANPKFEQMFGYGPGELNGQPVHIINYNGDDPEVQKRVFEIMDEIKRNGEATYEIQNIKKDGTPFWCQATTCLFEHPEYGTIFLGVQQDIDQRKAAEDALRKSEERFSRIFHSMPVPVLLSRLRDSCCLNANDKFLELTGFTREEIIGKNGVEILGLDQAESRERRKALLGQGSINNIEIELTNKKGELRWVIASLELVEIENENCALTSFYDITERRILEEKVRQSELLYRALARHLPDSAVMLFDKDMRFLLGEGTALTQSGFDPVLMEGKIITEVLPPESIARILPYYQAALAGLEHTFEDYYNGKVYLVHALPVKNEQGQIFAGMMVSQEITALKEAEMDVAAEKERLDVTLRSIGDGIITTDMNGNITLLNRVAEELTGWPLNDAVGLPVDTVLRLISENSRQPVPNLISEVLVMGQVVEMKRPTLLIARNGNELRIDDSAAPIRDQNGNIIGTVLVFRDITEQQRTTEEMLKTSKLEALGVLAGGIAHDFNNLLTGILGNLSLARLNLEETADAETLEFLEEAEQAALRSRDLTQKLLTFARGGTPVKKTTQLAQIIEDAAKFALHGATVNCEFNFAPDLWTVEVDAGQVSQVIQNLVLNAVQAMPKAGKLEIKGENIEVTEGSNPVASLVPGKYVRLSIKDEGVGIPSENLAKIFDPYFTTRVQGSGLGLAVCYSIVKKHDGQIIVESDVNKGSTFQVYLPISFTSKVEKLPVKEANSTGHGRVLVMDDEPALRQVADNLLSHLGYEVEVARDGEEAITYYRQAMRQGNPFGVVLLDLVVPNGLGGKQTLSGLLEIDKDVKAIVCSGYSNDPVMANYRQHGFKGVLVKPYRLQELSSLVQEVISN
ncbi:MAG TPA: PAS domain S-box protein [Chloroflexia bacterium]|nr:PAS domain S-box protein [Chloroflexia bacterium]